MRISYMAIPDVAQARAVTPARIIQLVSETTGVHFKSMAAKDRHRNLVDARIIAMWLIRNMTRHSLLEIGRMFNRDHTTVIHSLRTLENLMETDPAMRTFVEGIKERIR